MILFLYFLAAAEEDSSMSLSSMVVKMIISFTVCHQRIICLKLPANQQWF